LFFIIFPLHISNSDTGTQTEKKRKKPTKGKKFRQKKGEKDGEKIREKRKMMRTKKINHSNT